MNERDNSKNAILERYEKANMLSIVTSDRITFDSIRDVFFLVHEREKLLSKIQDLECEVASLKGELGR